MKQKERAELLDIQKILNEGFDPKEMRHSRGAALDAHARINILIDESSKVEQQKEPENG